MSDKELAGRVAVITGAGRSIGREMARIAGADNERRGNVILGKLEGNNPAGSVKDRPAINMIRRAEERGTIKPGDTLIEATSEPPMWCRTGSIMTRC